MSIYTTNGHCLSTISLYCDGCSDPGGGSGVEWHSRLAAMADRHVVSKHGSTYNLIDQTLTVTH